MAKKPTSDELADIFFKERKTNPSLSFETFCAKHGIIAHGQQDAVDKIIYEKTSAATSSDLSIFQRKLILPRRFLHGFDETGQFYRGTYIASAVGDPEPVVVRADGSIIREPLFIEAGLKFKDFPAVEDAAGTYGWSGQDVEAYIRAVRVGKAMPSIKDIYPKLRAYFARRGHYLDERTPAGLAIWSAGTFLGDSITLMRIIYIAPPGSGKSQILRAHRGVSAFPVLATDPTKASLFRMACGQTLAVDNFDKLPEEQKADVVHFAETTFEADGATYRVEDIGKHRIPTRFSGKVPMLFGGLGEDAYSEALMSRSVVIRLEKRPEGVEIVQVPEAGSEPEADAIRRDLYIWGMANAGRIRDALKTYDCGKKDRMGKFYASMLILADEAGAECRQEVEGWLDDHVQTEDIAEFSERGQVLSALWSLIERDLRSVQVQEVAEAWAFSLGISERDEQGRLNQSYRRELNKLSQKAAKFLKEIPGAKHSKPGNKSTLTFRKDALLRYLRRYNIIPPEQTTLNQPNTTPNPPNAPNTANTSTTPNQLSPANLSDEKESAKLEELGDVRVVRGKGDGAINAGAARPVEED